MDKFEFNLDKFINDAKSLGIKVKELSETPGLFTSINGHRIQIFANDFFPELNTLDIPQLSKEINVTRLKKTICVQGIKRITLNDANKLSGAA